MPPMTSTPSRSAPRPIQAAITRSPRACNSRIQTSRAARFRLALIAVAVVAAGTVVLSPLLGNGVDAGRRAVLGRRRPGGTRCSREGVWHGCSLGRSRCSRARPSSRPNTAMSATSGLLSVRCVAAARCRVRGDRGAPRTARWHRAQARATPRGSDHRRDRCSGCARGGRPCLSIAGNPFRADHAHARARRDGVALPGVVAGLVRPT